MKIEDTHPGRNFAVLFAGSGAKIEQTADFATALWWKLCVNSVGALSAPALKPSSVLHLDAIRPVAPQMIAGWAALKARRSPIRLAKRCWLSTPATPQTPSTHCSPIALPAAAWSGTLEMGPLCAKARNTASPPRSTGWPPSCSRPLTPTAPNLADQLLIGGSRCTLDKNKESKTNRQATSEYALFRCIVSARPISGC